jgi:hypothetical protein
VNERRRAWPLARRIRAPARRSLRDDLHLERDIVLDGNGPANVQDRDVEIRVEKIRRRQRRDDVALAPRLDFPG